MSTIDKDSSLFQVASEIETAFKGEEQAEPTDDNSSGRPGSVNSNSGGLITADAILKLAEAVREGDPDTKISKKMVDDNSKAVNTAFFILAEMDWINGRIIGAPVAAMLTPASKIATSIAHLLVPWPSSATLNPRSKHHPATMRLTSIALSKTVV